MPIDPREVELPSVLAPVIVAFPRVDQAFAAHARLLLGSARTPAELETRLRVMYPAARVVVRHRLAGFGDQVVWYAYRDGHVSSPSSDGWWLDPDVAWHDIGADGRWSDLNRAMESLVGLPREELVGRTWERFGTPEAIASQGPIWEIVERDGVIDSLFRLRRSDGRPLDVEYHMERTGPDLYRCWWRPVRIEVPPPG